MLVVQTGMWVCAFLWGAGDLARAGATHGQAERRLS